MSNVYIMKNKFNLIKVGYSGQPEQRRKDIVSSSGVDTTIEFLVEAPMCVEKSVHKILSEHREHGEWFSCSVHCAINAVNSVIKSHNDLLAKNLKEAEQRKSIGRAPMDEEDIDVLRGMPYRTLTLKQSDTIMNYFLTRLIEQVGGVSHLSKMLNLPYTTVKSWEDRGRISKAGAKLVGEHMTLGEFYLAKNLRPDL